MNKKDFEGFTLVNGDMKINVDLSRFESQYTQAQFYLDSQVMTDMVPYMPMQTGSLINRTRAESAALAGTGVVCAAAPPYGRFQYYGKVMVDEITGSPWARKGAKKVVTTRDLKYSNPKATPEWFETAKERQGKAWIQHVKDIAGGG